MIVDGDQLAPDADGIMDHIYIEHCYIHDVDGPNDWNDEFTGGIIFNVVGSAIRPSTSFRDLRIAYNTIKKVDLLAITGFVTTTSTAYQTEIDENDLWMRDIYIGHNYMEDIGQGAIDLCDAKMHLLNTTLSTVFCGDIHLSDRQLRCTPGNVKMQYSNTMRSLTARLQMPMEAPMIWTLV